MRGETIPTSSGELLEFTDIQTPVDVIDPEDGTITLVDQDGETYELIEFEDGEVVVEEPWEEPVGPTKLLLTKAQKLASIIRTANAGDDVKKRPPGGIYHVAHEPNSFGLPSVNTCPGKTAYCEQDCYAISAERRSATHRKLLANYDTLIAAETVEDKVELLSDMIDEYKASADKIGVKPENRRFRIHWSGDFYSVEYAEAWRITIEKNPDLKFWVYTRSFTPDVNVVPTLAGIKNLDLFLSVDQDNVDAAVPVVEQNPEVRIAYLVDYSEDAETMREKLGRTGSEFRAMACPENMRDERGNRKLALVSEKGGACARCAYCINNRDNWDVVFVKKGRKFKPQQELALGDATTPVEIMPRPKRTEQAARPVGQLVTANSLF